MEINKTILLEQLKEIAANVYSIAQNEYLYFDEPFKIKLTPHSPETFLWGICVSPSDCVYVCELVENEVETIKNRKPFQLPKERWHQIEACDRSADTVIPSIYQRVKLLKQSYEIQGKN